MNPKTHLLQLLHPRPLLSQLPLHPTLSRPDTSPHLPHTLTLCPLFVHSLSSLFVPLFGQVPSPLAYLSFVFAAGNLLCGPPIEYTEWTQFAELKGIWNPKAKEKVPVGVWQVRA